MIFLLSGLVIGGLLGELANKVDWLWWLSYGESFGLSNPIELDLNVITITFGLMLFQGATITWHALLIIPIIVIFYKKQLLFLIKESILYLQ
mgnify:CR=1 FL=1